MAPIRAFDLVLFWSLDRFSREGVLGTLQYLQRLTSYGVDWKSYTEQYIDSCVVDRGKVWRLRGRGAVDQQDLRPDGPVARHSAEDCSNQPHCVEPEGWRPSAF